MNYCTLCVKIWFYYGLTTNHKNRLATCAKVYIVIYKVIDQMVDLYKKKNYHIIGLLVIVLIIFCLGNVYKYYLQIIYLIIYGTLSINILTQFISAFNEVVRHQLGVFNLIAFKNSQTCIKRSPLGQ